jgi:hypothetical protein
MSSDEAQIFIQVKYRMTSDVLKICKTCNLCATEWHSWEAFITDRSLQVNGYQPSFDSPEDGVFLLTHNAPNCGSTLAIRAGDLKHFYHGPEYSVRNTGSESCPRLCLDPTHLEVCEQRCDMHWVRVVLQFLRSHTLP